MKKLQNSFNDFLPQNFRAFKQSLPGLTANQATVASLLRICCEEDDIKAIKLAFERMIGKPEKVVTIKRTVVRTIFPDAKVRRQKRIVSVQKEDETAVVPVTENKVVVNEADAPGFLLKKHLDEIGEEHNSYAYEILDNKESHTVVEVIVANLYAIAMRGSNLGAIAMLFDYLDGAVADVVRIDGEDVLLLENYVDIAPYEAEYDEDKNVWYVETEAVR